MLGLKLYNASATHVFKRITFGACYAPRAASSNATAAEVAASSSNVAQTKVESAEKDNRVTSSQDAKNVTKQKNTMVATVFKNLQVESVASKSKRSDANEKIEDRINNAETVNEILTIADSVPLNHKQAFRIVSILSEWSTADRIKLAEFQNDSRFLSVCRMLGRTTKSVEFKDKDNALKRMSGFGTDDFNTVLGVAGDDEAAKLIASITLPQMVKVMSNLAARKRRSTPLLRSLAFHISSTSERLNLKQCADTLFAMATLNFQDSALSDKVGADIQIALPKNTDKSSVVGSILISLAVLKYRDLDTLESLTQWILKHKSFCRPQDLSALFLTSAILNFKTSNMEEVRQQILPTIVQEDFNKSVDWLKHVWALTVLGFCNNTQLESVLDQTFVKKLQSDMRDLTVASKMKLLNINSYAQLVATDYKGPLLAQDSIVYEFHIAHTKSKQILVDGILDALKSLLPANNHVKSLIDSKMGFLIDVMCAFDAKRNPLPLDKEHAKSIKVALMVIDYHDICHGTHRSVSGLTTFITDLLERSGYKVLPVPYDEFNTSDKLLKRVQYLESKFKTLIKTNNV